MRSKNCIVFSGKLTTTAVVGSAVAADSHSLKTTCACVILKAVA